MNKTVYVLGAVLIAGFGVLGVIELKDAQTPYVTTLSDARAAGDRPIQFMGDIVARSARYDDESHKLVFTVKGRDGETMQIHYKGVKPANFENADKAVVRGRLRGNRIDATQVLLKCPSKYENR